MSETIFILGAGASKDAGAPLMKEFYDYADNINIEGRLKKYQSDFERIAKVISNLQAVHSKSTMDIVNIESIFAAIEMGLLIGKLPSTTTEEMEQLHKSMIRYLYITLEYSIKYHYTKGRIQPHDTYDRFGKMLYNMKEKIHGKYYSVITFNYDIALEYALHFRGIPYDYCINDETENRNLHLLKLHGSVNWGSCQNCKKIIPWDVSVYCTRLNPDPRISYPSTVLMHLW